MWALFGFVLIVVRVYIFFGRKLSKITALKAGVEQSLLTVPVLFHVRTFLILMKTRQRRRILQFIYLFF